jgi:hypothetical protein
VEDAFCVARKLAMPIFCIKFYRIYDQINQIKIFFWMRDFGIKKEGLMLLKTPFSKIIFGYFMVHRV